MVYVLEAWDIENFQGMVNKALVLEEGVSGSETGVHVCE
jgi:hypothetical protein